ncbi:39S ribosomal protein L55, mitochondrial [Lamellibrachia satsuma]|nr:39S ribosomal protein L55, mitochondrial [Lamellibrachia satsuma]
MALTARTFSRYLAATERCWTCRQAAISLRRNCNKASITRINRKVYTRMYESTMMVMADGSTINIRYNEPREIIKLPLDVSTLSPEERAARLAKRKPKQKIVVEEDIEDSFDINQYSHLWKKK